MTIHIEIKLREVEVGTLIDEIGIFIEGARFNVKIKFKAGADIVDPKYRIMEAYLIDLRVESKRDVNLPMLLPTRDGKAVASFNGSIKDLDSTLGVFDMLGGDISPKVSEQINASRSLLRGIVDSYQQLEQREIAALVGAAFSLEERSHFPGQAPPLVPT